MEIITITSIFLGLIILGVWSYLKFKIAKEDNIEESNEKKSSLKFEILGIVTLFIGVVGCVAYGITTESLIIAGTFLVVSLIVATFYFGLRDMQKTLEYIAENNKVQKKMLEELEKLNGNEIINKR